jgi:hypothetical protein
LASLLTFLFFFSCQEVHMSSQTRIEANRRNARHSTGPTTPEGKAAVRFNSLTHGAFAAHLVLPDEDAEAFRALEAGFLQSYQPACQAEQFLVDRMILAAWRLRRLAAMESRVLRYHAGQGLNDAQLARSMTFFLRDNNQPADSGSHDSPPEDLIALAWIRDGNGPNTMTKLLRYQNSLERSFYRALNQLQALRREPDSPPAEPLTAEPSPG